MVKISWKKQNIILDCLFFFDTHVSEDIPLASVFVDWF